MEATYEQEIDLLQKTIDHICYAFYRYEIKPGLASFESMVSQLMPILTRHAHEEERIQEINQLLEMIVVAVEKKDYLIAADLLRYELLQRIALLTSVSA
ncbi:hypothetical protein [Brevibacillus fulvus]|uniref:Uncharacterized protein n=1 Tax=Brevibacillus fulvus TaxID=1125967 RepID=A0A938Y3X8_9BACL|nr:hypothetical protein [Brevibacillus fulvus]MBM7591501.1 hypothetical protein [Brevibacillus fulvus]